MDIKEFKSKNDNINKIELNISNCEMTKPGIIFTDHLVVERCLSWLKGHAWKACVQATVPRVRIPVSPPFFSNKPKEITNLFTRKA